MPAEPRRRRLILFWLITYGAVLAWSAIRPFDRFTWWLEAAPALAGLIVVIALHRSFRFTDLAYWLMWLHAIILMIGAHYTYARVPLFDWIKDAFELDRNHYDRVGHFAQGFIPAILAREVLIRQSPLRAGKWLFWIVVSICLAFSAAYELFEWRVARATGEAAEDFLGTQGDAWDTQIDMSLALVGSIASLSFLGRTHDRQLEALIALAGSSSRRSTRP